MATLHYDTIVEHRGHDIRVFVRYDETAGLECVECHDDIFTADNNETEN